MIFHALSRPSSLVLEWNYEQSNPIRVVLADDHPVVRAGIRQLIETAGDIQVVAEAADGDQAVHAIQEPRPM